MQHKLLNLALLAGLSLSGAAQAALLDRGGELIYDDVLKITWLADANLAAMNTFGVSGIAESGAMNWNTAQSWIAAMNTAEYLGYDDWRLPTALNQDETGPCSGYNCTSSEMGHLFYVDGDLSAYQSILTSTTLDDYFTNMQSSLYWSGTEYAPPPSGAWVFNAGDGYQILSDKNFSYYAWAVRPGDVAAVPEPATLMLLGLGLAGLGAMRRRG